MSMVYMTYAHLLRATPFGMETLLGIRDSKSGFANQIRSGPGGNFDVKDGGSARRCIVRECKEELGIDVDLESIFYLATSDCYHGGILKRRVHFFNIMGWNGEPLPIDGFRDLQWFDLKNLPYSQMFPDLNLWLPRALQLPSDMSKVLRVKICYENDSLENITDFSFSVIDRRDGLLYERL